MSGARQDGRPGRTARAAALLAAVLALPGCAALERASCPDLRASAAESEIFRNAEAERAAHLERDLARLRADLAQAEATMVAIESGLRGVHTRADAVSAIADARISVDRAARSVPWRGTEVSEARAKLQEAERQLEAGRAGSSVFFASRAQRIAENLNEEAQLVEKSAGARFVNTLRVNLRSGPSTDHPVIEVLVESTPVFPEHEQGEWLMVRTLAGSVGWLHASLVGPR